jgi:two-component system chemotaxis sensor kinase CheA
VAKKDDDFLKKLLGIFKIEALEHIKAMSSGLIKLEKAATPEKQMEIIETVFREAHSLKGAARAVNMTDVERLCQSLETVFAALKRQKIISSPQMLDVLHRALGSLDKLLAPAEAEGAKSAKSPIAELISSLEDMASSQVSGRKQMISRIRRKSRAVREKTKVEGQQPPDAQTPTPGSQPLTPDTVRISTAKLESLLRQVEELLWAKLAASQNAAEVQEVNGSLDQWKKEWANAYPKLQRIRQRLEKESNPRQGEANSELTELVEFLDWNCTYVKNLETRLKTLAASTEHDRHLTGRMVDNLLDDMRRAVMLPFSSLLETFPKLVRDLCRDQGKEADISIVGADIDIDRRILEEMKTPFIHLVRNCIDHGIEKPEEREAKLKPRRGTVTLRISQKNSSKVEIVVADDGVGMDVAKIKAAALKLGILSQEDKDKISQTEALSLIFKSGVTTSPIITDISGRGLGLAIVQEKVDRLGGITSVESSPNQGTTIRFLLPLTLATFRGLLVNVGEQIFAIPSANVNRVVRAKKDDIRTTENRETIGLNGQAVSLVWLHDVLGLPRKEAKSGDSESIVALVLGTGEKRVAFSVDEILGEQEMQVKSLGKQLSRVRYIAGATVLATGKVVPILNVSDLMKSAARISAAPSEVAAGAEKAEAKRKSILVVEDSIAARTLLKNILESAGYQVKTAIDGIDAFTVLRSEDFDMVVSDVDMPRMNGFDLTVKVRAEQKLSDLPVVLVTALESGEDRERGIDVGANAYIVKSSFDQSNLLEVVRRLL